MASGTVKIGKRHYRVRKAKISKSAFADCDTVTKDIRLAHNINGVTEAKKLLHEIMHGIHAEYVKLSFSDSEEHAIINAYERGFSEFAKHNKEAWIMLAIRMAGVK